MGFSLRMSAVSPMAGKDEEALRAYLSKNRVQFREQPDPSPFKNDPFFEIVESESGVTIRHPEVGEDWWETTKTYLYHLLGDDHYLTAPGMHEDYGVAVPGDVDSTMLNVPPGSEPTITICRVTFWEKI